MYLLDTNICIYLMKGKYPELQKRVESEELFNIGISSITVAELEYGISKSIYSEKNRDLIYGFLAPFEIIPFTEIDTEDFGILRAYLNSKGTPIGPYDMQIASQCLARKLTLVTNNVKEFERVPNLSIDNWVNIQ